MHSRRDVVVAINGRLAFAWRSLRAGKPQGWLQVLITVAFGALALWRDEFADKPQLPLVSDVLGVLPWWAWGMLALGVFAVALNEGAYRLYHLPDIDVIPGLPVVHKWDEKVWVVVPYTHIRNHSQKSVDLDVSVSLSPSCGTNLIVSPDSEPIPDLERAVNFRQIGGNRQLGAVVKLDPRSRELGYIAVVVPEPFGHQNNFQSLDDLEAMSFTLSDGLTDHVLAEVEVWPADWPGLLVQ